MPHATGGRKGKDDSFKLPPIRPDRNQNFQPFDGSRPLLPPWRPPSIEAEFNHQADRISSREKSTTQSQKKIVKIHSHGFGTLFAEVVQELGEEQEKVWLRPLLLDSDESATSVDLRGGSDVVLERCQVEDVDSETSFRISVNLMATESDLLGRALSDDRWNEISSKAVMTFMRTLSNDDEKP